MSKSPYQIVPQWSAPDNIKAFSTTKIFSGDTSDCRNTIRNFNLAKNVFDEVCLVEKNRKLLESFVSYPIAWLNQSHSTKSIRLYARDAKNFAKPAGADASWTTSKEITLAILTADCMPIILCSVTGDLIVAIHAGWKGLLDGIIQKTLFPLIDSNCFMAWIGPSIQQKNFEIGEEVVKLFLAQNSDYHTFIKVKQEQPSKYLLDLQGIATYILKDMGIGKVYNSGLCTFADDRFYSYRKNNNTGRFATLIWIE